MKNYTAEEIIEILKLEPLPEEGGWFRLMYKSPWTMLDLPSEFEGVHTSASYIYYLLKKGEVSKLHRLNNDEIWSFISGGTLLLELKKTENDNESVPILIGNDFERTKPTFTIPANTWQSASIVDGDYVLVVCFVTPSYEDSDFELGGE